MQHDLVLKGSSLTLPTFWHQPRSTNTTGVSQKATAETFRLLLESIAPRHHALHEQRCDEMHITFTRTVCSVFTRNTAALGVTGQRQ